MNGSSLCFSKGKNREILIPIVIINVSLNSFPCHWDTILDYKKLKEEGFIAAPFSWNSVP